MFLLPNSKKWYHTAIHISCVYRYGITTFVLASILAVWFFCIYQPLQRSIEYYAIQIKQLSTQLRHTEKAIFEQKNITAENSALAEKLSTFFSAQKNAKNLGYITYILEHAAKAGCSVEQYTIQQTQQKDFYSKTVLTLNMQTSFEQCVHFLSALKATEKMITFQSIVLEQKNAPLYSAQLTLAFIAPNSAKNPST